MSILYGHNTALKEQVLTERELAPYINLIAYDDISRGNDKQIREFCESERANVLVEKAVLKKNTMVRLSKADDEKRRIKLCAYQLAKDENDVNWKKMKFHRDQWKKYRDLLMKKYGSRAAKMAKISQKEYIKRASKPESEDNK